MDTLVKILEINGFKRDYSFFVEDRYMLLTDINIDLNNENLKEILNETVRIRHYNYIESNEERSEIIKKVKTFDKDGNILKQEIFNCVVLDKLDAYNFIKSLGYKDFFYMTQKVTDYVKEKELIIVCEIDDKIYIEIENKNLKGEVVYYSVEEMIKGIKKYKIPHDESNYFKQKVIDKLKKNNK